MQIWDVREKCAAPIHSFSGAFVCGDGVDIFGNDILVASHQEENQITVFDLRAHKSPREMYAVKGNNMYAAGFSKGELEHDRFFCCGGIGGEGFDKSQKNNVHIIDVKRDYQLAATVRDLPGGVVSLDYPYTLIQLNSSPINSSKGSSVVLLLVCNAKYGFMKCVHNAVSSFVTMLKSTLLMAKKMMTIFSRTTSRESTVVTTVSKSNK